MGSTSVAPVNYYKGYYSVRKRYQVLNSKGLLNFQILKAARETLRYINFVWCWEFTLYTCVIPLRYIVGSFTRFAD